VPDGDARDILEEAGHALLVRPDDVDGMAGRIREHVERWRAGSPPPRPEPSVVERYEYGRLADGLASVFRKVLRTSDSARSDAVQTETAPERA
jgi:hypothetical protein